jgi:hypothetical protein
MQTKPQEITYDKFFNGREIYDDKKSNKGFYVGILEKLEKLIDYSLCTFKIPRAAHFIIEEPDQDKLKNLSEDIKRFCAQRSKDTDKADLPEFVYLSTLETRPKNKQEHLHLLIISDGLNYRDFGGLEERLRKFSNNRKARHCCRSIAFLPYDIDEETGEFRYTKRGDFARKGNTSYHDLRTEADDAFKRFSYFAKVYSKKKDFYLSCSRLPSKAKRDAQPSHLEGSEPQCQQESMPDPVAGPKTPCRRFKSTPGDNSQAFALEGNENQRRLTLVRFDSPESYSVVS